LLLAGIVVRATGRVAARPSPKPDADFTRESL
jgi:hypothetical protein